MDTLHLPYLPKAAHLVATPFQWTVEALRIEIAAGIVEVDILRRFPHEAPPKTKRPFEGVGDVAAGLQRGDLAPYTTSTGL